MGDIAASRALQVGLRAFPDLRSPHCLIELADELSLEKCFESFRNYISESLGILFTSQSPHHSGKASRRRVLTLLFSNFTNFFYDHAGILESFRWFYDENIVLVPPVRGLVEVSRGVEL